jgi:competence protein ComEC
VWLLAAGTVIGSIAATNTPFETHPAVGWILIAIGVAALLVAAIVPRWWAVWLVVGIALAGGRGLQTENRLREVERLAAMDGAAVRATVRTATGWEPTRWGWRATVAVEHATFGEEVIRLAGPWRLEVRGVDDPGSLPRPGSKTTCLARLRGEPHRLFLVVPSARLLEVNGEPGGVAALRDGMVAALFKAAGTRLERIRSAELAAALALGRRDVLTYQRRDGWRRSGLAHLLAVSGLHVGLVAGLMWLGLKASGIHPRTGRWLMMAAVPGYAVLAGASPSALRAALMAVVYLVGRQLGRAVLPMAAVLLAAVVLLLVRPQLMMEAGFQLTVLVTAALVRWAPVLAARLPGPKWLAAAVAVPLVAQLAAGPIVAHHFRTAIPGAVVANLAVPALLAPTLASCLAATLLAPVWPWAAAVLLDIVHLFEGVLWTVSAPGRWMELVVPTIPVIAATALCAAGWSALQAGRRGGLGAAAWTAILAVLTGWWAMRPAPPGPRVELLPVADGLAAAVSTPDGTALMDGGRWTRELAELLADGGYRGLSWVLVSHTDEDHMGGIETVLRGLSVGGLVLPRWMVGEPSVVPLLRAARRNGVEVVPVTKGQVLRIGATAVEILWPPPGHEPEKENERSLVARVVLAQGAVLLTSDVGSPSELDLSASGSLPASVLVVGHHGSRGSTTEAFLDRVDPELALIPAGPENRYHHPHKEVIERLEHRGIDYRYPKRDGRCGAVFRESRWVLYP